MEDIDYKPSDGSFNCEPFEGLFIKPSDGLFNENEDTKFG